MPQGGLYGTQREMLEALRRRLAEPGPSRFADETLYTLLDEAAHEVSEDTGCVRNGIEFNWPANTPRIDAQSEIFDFVDVLDCNWRLDEPNATRYPLEFISNERDLRLDSGPPITGIPRYMTIAESYNYPPANYNLNKYLDIWPVPSEPGIVELHVTVLSWSVPATERETSVIPIRRAFRDLVIIKALQFAYENLGRPDLKKEKQIEYEKMLSGVRLRLLDMTTSDYGQIFDHHGFGYI